MRVLEARGSRNYLEGGDDIKCGGVELGGHSTLYEEGGVGASEGAVGGGLSEDQGGGGRSNLCGSR